MPLLLPPDFVSIHSVARRCVLILFSFRIPFFSSIFLSFYFYFLYYSIFFFLAIILFLLLFLLFISCQITTLPHGSFVPYYHTVSVLHSAWQLPHFFLPGLFPILSVGHFSKSTSYSKCIHSLSAIIVFTGIF